MEPNLQDNTKQTEPIVGAEEKETKTKNKNAIAQPEHNEIEKQLDACKQELSNWKDKYLRAQADLDNFRKRITKERASWADNAQAKILHDLLPIVDNFERAFPEKSEKNESWLEGFAIIHKSLQKLLENFDVKKMNNYETFDPTYHEALVQVESDNHESGQIVEILQSGYLFKDQVLRPAKVSVAK